MKACGIPFLLIANMFLTSCAYVPPSQDDIRRVSRDYTATGTLKDARAYVYGHRTLLEFDHSDPSLIIVRDRNSDSVGVEKVGKFYRLDRQVDSFTVWVNGASTTFLSSVATEASATPQLGTVKVAADDLNTYK